MASDKKDREPDTRQDQMWGTRDVVSYITSLVRIQYNTVQCTDVAPLTVSLLNYSVRHAAGLHWVANRRRKC